MTILMIYLAVGAASWFVISVFTNERVKQLAERPEEVRDATDNLIEQKWGEPKFMWQMFLLVLAAWPLFAPMVAFGAKILIQYSVMKSVRKAKAWILTNVWMLILLVARDARNRSSSFSIRHSYSRAKEACELIREIARLITDGELEEATQKWYVLIDNPTVPPELGAEIFASIVNARLEQSFKIKSQAQCPGNP